MASSTPPVTNVSRALKLFKARREALVLEAYQDGDHLSIGFGHNGPDVKPGQKITAKEAFALMEEDIAKRVPDVLRALKGAPVTQYQFDALFDNYYQGGSDDLDRVVPHVIAGNHQEAMRTLLLNDRNAAGERMPGLLKRCSLRVAIYGGAEYGNCNPIPFWPGNPRTSKQEWYEVSYEDLPL